MINSRIKRRIFKLFLSLILLYIISKTAKPRHQLPSSLNLFFRTERAISS